MLKSLIDAVAADAFLLLLLFLTCFTNKSPDPYTHAFSMLYFLMNQNNAVKKNCENFDKNCCRRHFAGFFVCVACVLPYISQQLRHAIIMLYYIYPKFFLFFS